MKTEDELLLNKIDFFKSCSSVEQDFRGHSSALRYICEKDNKKYFIKIYKGNRVNDIKNISNIYNKLEIPTAKIFEIVYLDEVDKTFVVYEFIYGKTLLEYTKVNSINDIENVGMCVGRHLSKFKSLKGDKDETINLFEQEIGELIENLYSMIEYYEKNGESVLSFIDVDRLCNDFNQYKKCVYNTQPTFIHRDINLKNILVKNDEVCFIDTDGGKFSFSVLDFRGICWWTWDGENKVNEQAMYRGIFKGLLGENIPDVFHQQLAFTIIYEFLLKIEEVNKNKDLERMEFIFSKFGDIFTKTNYFENYKFDWIN